MSETAEILKTIVSCSNKPKTQQARRKNETTIILLAEIRRSTTCSLAGKNLSATKKSKTASIAALAVQAKATPVMPCRFAKYHTAAA